MIRKLGATTLLAGMLVAQTKTDAAWDLLAKGNRPQAVQVLRQILQSTPSDGEANLLLGSILTEDGNYSEGIPLLREAVKRMPRSAAAQNGLGDALVAIGDGAGARSAFEKGIALDPKLSPARVSLALLLLKAGESDKAVAHLDRAIVLMGKSPEAAEALYLRAKVYADRNNPEKAAALLKQAVALRSDFGEAWSDLGDAYKTLGEELEAFAAYQRAVQLDPENSVSQSRLGSEYLRQGKPHEAVVHLREAMRLDPKNQSTLNSLQLALRQDEKPEEAAQVKAQLQEVLREIDRESQNAFAALKLNNEGSAMEKTGDVRGAMGKYRAAVDLDPTHVGIRVNYAVALLRLAQWKEGLDQLREALKRDPNNLQIRAALADAIQQAPPEFGGAGKKPTPATRR